LLYQSAINAFSTEQRPILVPVSEQDGVGFFGDTPKTDQDIVVKFRNIGKRPAVNLYVDRVVVFPGMSVPVTAAPTVLPKAAYAQNIIVPANEMAAIPLQLQGAWAEYMKRLVQGELAMI